MSYVGIFWFVPANFGRWSALVAGMTPIENLRTHEGQKLYPVCHADYWRDLAGIGRRELRAKGYPRVIAEADYRTFPRGRVDFEAGCRRSIVRADARLLGPEFIAQIAGQFDILPGHLTVFNEPAYTSTAPIDPPKPWD